MIEETAAFVRWMQRNQIETFSLTHRGGPTEDGPPQWVAHINTADGLGRSIVVDEQVVRYGGARAVGELVDRFEAELIAKRAEVEA